MPIYEYHCDACEERLEKIQKFSDPPLRTCPECGEDKLRKLVSAAAFKLKGTGWYETDFKDKPKDKARDSKSDHKTDTNKDAEGKKSEKKSDPSTSATKPETKSTRSTE